MSRPITAAGGRAAAMAMSRSQLHASGEVKGGLHRSRSAPGIKVGVVEAPIAQAQRHTEDTCQVVLVSAEDVRCVACGMCSIRPRYVRRADKQFLCVALFDSCMADCSRELRSSAGLGRLPELPPTRIQPRF